MRLSSLIKLYPMIFIFFSFSPILFSDKYNFKVIILLDRYCKMFPNSFKFYSFEPRLFFGMYSVKLGE